MATAMPPSATWNASSTSSNATALRRTPAPKAITRPRAFSLIRRRRATMPTNSELAAPNPHANAAITAPRIGRSASPRSAPSELADVVPEHEQPDPEQHESDEDRQVRRDEDDRADEGQDDRHVEEQPQEPAPHQRFDPEGGRDDQQQPDPPRRRPREQQHGVEHDRERDPDRRPDVERAAEPDLCRVLGMDDVSEVCPRVAEDALACAAELRLAVLDDGGVLGAADAALADLVDDPVALRGNRVDERLGAAGPRRRAGTDSEPLRLLLQLEDRGVLGRNLRTQLFDLGRERCDPEARRRRGVEARERDRVQP